jgi:hypothetical protein
MVQDRGHVVYSAKDLLGIEEDPNQWIVPNMIPRAGITLVFGQGASFKSSIVFDLCVAISAGEHFSLRPLKFTVSLPGPVFINSTEGSLQKNKWRILAHSRAYNVNPADLPLYYCQQPFYMDDLRDVEALEEYIKEIKPVVVVLDPLDSFFSGEENSARDTKPVRRQIDRLIQTYNTAFVVVHHQGKKKKDVEAAPRGSSAWYDWADSVLHVNKKQVKIPGLDNPATVVEVKGTKQRDGEEGHLFAAVPNIDKVLKKVTFTFFDGKNTASIVQAYFKQEIYQLLLGRQTPMTNQMLADTLNVRPERIVQALTGLEADGLIAKDGALARAFGPNGGRTRQIPAWRALVQRTVVDDALTMVKIEGKAMEEIDKEYLIEPSIPEPIVEVGEPRFEVIAPDDENGDKGNDDSVREVGVGEGP